MIVVEDVLEALTKWHCLAGTLEAQIIAVTGSVGKTTTKEALRHVLSEVGKVHASVASFNNHWGVPLTLARMPADTDYGVFEIGMNHPGRRNSSAGEDGAPACGADHADCTGILVISPIWKKPTL